MRHRHKGKKLGRKKAPKKALMRSLTTSLILYEKMKTTEGKAKAIKPIIEKLITKGKKNNLASRRELHKILFNDNAVKKVLEELSPRYKERKGGYLRIIKLNMRQGDAAKMAQIEFV